MKKITLGAFVLLSCFIANAQTTINGTVSNEWGSTLDDAHVSLLGTNTGAISEHGIFTLNAQKGDILEVSHLGYSNAYVVVDNIKQLNIELKMEQLDEVLVIADIVNSIRCVTGCTVSITSRCGAQSKIISKPLHRRSASNKTILYPNTSLTGLFNLKTVEDYKKVDVFVFNLQGQVILTTKYQDVKDTIVIDLSGYASGMYLVKVMANGKLLDTKRAIKG